VGALAEREFADARPRPLVRLVGGAPGELGEEALCIVMGRRHEARALIRPRIETRGVALERENPSAVLRGAAVGVRHRRTGQRPGGRLDPREEGRPSFTPGPIGIPPRVLMSEAGPNRPAGKPAKRPDPPNHQ